MTSLITHHARDEREGAPDVRDTDPVRVPWNYGLREVELPRKLAENFVPAGPSEASVLTPPSCTASPDSRTIRRRVRTSSTETSQPAAFLPKVVGSACWSSVR